MLNLRIPSRKSISGLRKRICGIFGRRNIDVLPQGAEGTHQTDDNTASLDLQCHRRRLPLEMECEIFKFIKTENQQKLICGMGTGIYGIFRHKLLIKTKRLCNPNTNGWEQYDIKTKILRKKRKSGNIALGLPESHFFAMKPFPIRGEHCRMDKFPGTIVYYFEVGHKRERWEFRLGLSDGSIPEDSWVGMAPNSYARHINYIYCRLSGTEHNLDMPMPHHRWAELKWGEHENVHGCGILLEPNGRISIFFTFNGILLKKQIPISPSVDRLYPTIYQYTPSPFETNFGDDPSKPFQYDIRKCPGMVFE